MKQGLIDQNGISVQLLKTYLSLAQTLKKPPPPSLNLQKIPPPQLKVSNEINNYKPPPPSSKQT